MDKASAARVIDRARALVGTGFRLHGRDPGTGLDCVGVALIASGIPPDAVPDDYRLRGASVGGIVALARTCGLERVSQPSLGALALVDCGHRHLHLIVLADASHIHAHAGLRRVVETPGWPNGIVAVLARRHHRPGIDRT